MTSAMRQLPDFLMIRHICALAALLALMLQGSSGGHMLLVEHSRCAEHGELVHGSGADHHGSNAPTSADSASVQGTSPAHEDAHDHCTVSVDRRDAPASIDDSGWRAYSFTTLLSRAPANDLFSVRSHRYRLAPKTSPPA
ncbi:MAG: hypothetical protein ACN4G0_19585 [Polyangiales bacterium]